MSLRPEQATGSVVSSRRVGSGPELGRAEASSQPRLPGASAWATCAEDPRWERCGAVLVLR